jgi:hypothetical protein
MISRNVHLSFSTSMHDRNAFSHIKLSNLMCVRCIKCLTIVFDYICVTRVNRKKCRYCANQRHKCVFVNVRLRIDCATLLIIINVALFLKYNAIIKKRRRLINDRESHQSSNRSCFLNLKCVHLLRASRLKNTNDSSRIISKELINCLFNLSRRRLA